MHLDPAPLAGTAGACGLPGSHLRDETLTCSEMRAGMATFKPFSKPIRQKESELDLRGPPDRESDIRHFLFGGVRKSIMNRTGFDSDAEREFAIALEDDPGVLKWVRPPLGQLPIHCRGEVEVIPDDCARQMWTLSFMLGMAVKELSC